MKKGKLLIACIFYTSLTQAQSSQIKLYLQQIAANKVLIGYIQKGYKIARKGLTTIGNIKNGDFNLHQDFFGSLKAINPKIKNAAAILDIIAMQADIIKVYKNNYKRIKQSDQFTKAEIDYIYSVFEKMLDATAATLEELLALVTADKYQMSDDERIKRIDGLYAEMQTNYVFAQHFGNDALILAMQRLKEKQDVEISSSLYGIKVHP